MKYRVPVLETFGWQEPVKSSTINMAPVSPVKGDRYIVPVDVVPGNSWDGHAKSIAWYTGTEWSFDVPSKGWSAFVESQLLAFTYNGTEWGVAEAGAVVTTEIFVDKNRIDTYPQNGSRSLPFKTINSAIAAIVNAGDNTLDKAYSMYVMPGLYTENVTFDSTNLVNLTFKGSASNSVILRPTTGNALQSTSNNDGLLNLVFEDVTIDAPIVFHGSSNATSFGSFLAFDDVKLTPNAVMDIENSLSVHILGETEILSQLTLSNVGLISLSNDYGMASGQALTVKNLPAANLPIGITKTTVYLMDNKVERDITWDLTGGGLADVYLISSVLGSGENNNVIIPENVSYVAINSTLLGNYTYNGSLKLRGSFVTGVLDPNSTGELSMKVQSADMLSLGLPPDGALSDGLVDLNDESTVVYAIDEFNEILKDLAPPQSDALTGVVLSNNRTLYTGRVPAGAATSWMTPEVLVPGAQLTNVITNNGLTLSIGLGAPDSFVAPGTPPVVALTTNSGRARKGDEGILIAKHQIGTDLFSSVASLDIKTNFKENPPGSSPPRPHVQDLSTWDAQGSGDACTNATVSFTNGKGTLQITDVRWFNDFNKWQKFNAQLNIVSLDPGFNKFSILHDLAQDEESAETKIYYADNAVAMTFNVSPTIVQNTILSSRYVSGIRYYSTGDTFDINYSGSNVFNSIYHSSQCSMFRFEGQNSDQGRQPSTPPSINDNYLITETIAINRPDYYDSDTRLTANFYHPYKSAINQTTASENRLVNTYSSTRSTDLQDYFTDENHRLPIGDYDTVPSMTGNWDSTQLVAAGNAIVGGNSVPGVRSGNTDYSVGYLPAGNPNYSGRSGNEVYIRAFKSASSRSGFQLKLAGLTSASVGIVGSGNVNVEIKLPGQTGWLDAGKAFNSAQFTGVTGDGCQTSVSSDTWTITFGTFSTANCNGTIVVRITFRNTTGAITGIQAINY